MKTGCNRRCIVLTDRDRVLLSEIARLGVITGEQAGHLGSFHSKTRRNERLLKLVRAGYLARCFSGTIAGGRIAVYRLRGTHQALALRPGHLEHQLMICEVYVRLRHVPDAVVETQLIGFDIECSALLPKEFSLIPDAYLEVSVPSGVRAFFLEVDRGTEALGVWRRKAASYLSLARAGVAPERLGHAQFSVLVVAHSDRRVQGIRSVVRPETEKIFWFTDLLSLTREGAYAPIWLRPAGDARLPLVDMKGDLCATALHAAA